MSSSEGAVGTVPVTITAQKDTEIFIIDSAFDLKARGVESLRQELEPGLYKLKFKAGPLIEETHVIVEEGGGPIELTGPPLHFTSPAPLSDTGTTHEYQEAAAADLSRQVHRSIAPGSQIFVFARSFTDGPDDPRRLALDNAARGLTLHDLDGRLLVDLERDGRRGSGPDASTGYNVEVAPGVYRLRVRTRQWGALEQAVVASPGWQTQIFLWQTDDEGGRVVDLSDTSVLLAEVGAGFTPDSDALRSSELARASLVERRTFMPRRQLQEMLSAEVTNPMVGIYAAHALIAAGETERDLVSDVSDALRELLGEHPDVEALRLYVDGAAAASYLYQAPPMLTSSWSLVVSASARHPELVPPESLAARVGSTLWGDGPWLIWLADRLDAETATKIDVPLADTVSRIAALASDSAADETGMPQVGVDLSGVEEALLSVVAPRGAGTRRPRKMAVPRDAAAEVPGPSEPTSQTAHLAARLGVAPATLESVAATLLSKLEEPGGGGTHGSTGQQTDTRT